MGTGRMIGSTLIHYCPKNRKSSSSERAQPPLERVRRALPLPRLQAPARTQLRYFVQAADGLLLALLGCGAAAWKTAPRDRFVGWDPATRQRNLPLVVNHARYLILPWTRIPSLTSHLLACLQRQLPDDWHTGPARWQGSIRTEAPLALGAGRTI